MKKQNFSLILSVILGLGLGMLVPSSSGPQSTGSGTIPGAVAGESLTLLPDGRWLMTGGMGSAGPLTAASVWDSNTNTTVLISGGLQLARAYHTATLLPDGTVLILGGVGADGQATGTSELFDPPMQQFASLPSSGLTPRAYHTATLLTEGRVLIAGGISDKGMTLATAELWDPRSQTMQTLPAKLSMARHSHTATLLSNGTVMLWGGVDNDGNALNNGELYDPVSQQFTLVERFTPPSDSDSPGLTGSMPLDGATDVPVDSLIAVRFSEPLRMETINNSTVTLTGPQGAVTAKVVPAEGGMLTFVTPMSVLLPGANYSMQLSGPTDRGGFSLPDTTISFTTADAPSDEDWIPGAENMGGDWRAKRPDSPWRSLPPLQAEPGVTALSGQVLKLDGEPLANVTLQIEDKTARTDTTGRFLLRLPPSGPRVLVIDGQSANQPGKTYGIFEVAENIIDGQTTVLPYTIWMTKIDTAHAVTISSPTTTEVVITTPLIPGLEVHIPPQTVIRDRNGLPVRSVSITAVPVDRPPFPLPSGVNVPIYFTVQPGGANIETLSDLISHGARIIYPNFTNRPAGSRVNFWNYDPEVRGWYIYGMGTVTADRKQIIPDLGVAIYKFTGAMIENYNNDYFPPDDSDEDGEPVNLATGLFVLRKTDLFLPGVLPITLTRTFQSENRIPGAFGQGMTHSYQITLSSINNYVEADIILPDGGQIHYNRISSGTGWTDAVYEASSTPTKFYKSQITWVGEAFGGHWELVLKDGTVYVFGENAPLQSIRDRYGNTIVLTRTNGQSGNITNITSSSGRWIDLTYDGSNHITQIKDNIGRVVTYNYTNGFLTSVTDPNGGITEYTYSGGHIMTIKDARGIVYLSNEYNVSRPNYGPDLVSKQTQADGTTYNFTYTFDCGACQPVICLPTPGGGFCPPPPWPRIIQTDVTDPRGKVRRVTFNYDGYTLTDTHALGQPEQQTITYERQGGTSRVLSVTDALSRKTAYTYDATGNTTGITRLFGTPDAVTSSFTYEPNFNQLASITDPLNHTTSFGRDALSNLTSVTDPLSHVSTLTYNASGQPTAITDALGNTTSLTYDAGDLVSITDPLGNTTTRFVDSAGRLLSMTNPIGSLTRYDYNALSQLTKVTDPLGGLTQFSYDPNGNLLSVTDARNNPTIYTYDNMDHLATRKDPLLAVESYPLYDGKGNLKTFIDRKGQTTQFVHDALNRRTKATYAGGSTTDYTYDSGNRLTQIVDSVSGTITRGYDNLDRLTSETTPQGSVSYTYDAAGRRATMTVAGQPIVNYTYDNANKLTDITQSSSNVHFDYDAAGRKTKTTLPNGVTENYTYDAASRLTGIEYWNGTTLMGNLTYEYDAVGNRTKIGGGYARTGLPQAVSSASYNAANQQTNWAGTVQTYDANGNLTNDGSTTYAWDARNRLASMTGPGLDANFQYDGRGRRVNKTINGVSTGFLYDRLNPAQELTGGTPSANILTGLRVDQYLTRTDATGTKSFLTDHLGSTVALSDSSGIVQTEYTYESFGKTAVTGATSSNSYQYTGREIDSPGLYYYRARYYRPGVQRFISEDPLSLTLLNRLSHRYPRAFFSYRFLQSDPQRLNLYSYVINNPLRYIDPLGLTLYEMCAPSTGCFYTHFSGDPQHFMDSMQGETGAQAEPSPEQQDALNDLAQDVADEVLSHLFDRLCPTCPFIGSLPNVGNPGNAPPPSGS